MSDIELSEIVFAGLGDDDFSVRREAVRLAAAAADIEEVRAAIISALRDESSLSRRSAAMEAIAKVGARILPALRELLDDPREGVRRLVIDSVGRIEHPHTFALLRVAVDDDSPAVRAATAEALGRVEKTRAAPLLVRLLETENSPSVRLAALLTSESFGISLSAPLLMTLVRTPLTAPSALRMLGKLGEAPPLVRALLSRESSRQKAALIGLTSSFDANDEATLEAIRADKERLLLSVARSWIERRDAAAASGALLVGAALGDISFFSLVVARADLAELHAAIMRAAISLRHPTPAIALENLANSLDDDTIRDAAKEVLLEARDFIVERMPSRVVQAGSPANASRDVVTTPKSYGPKSFEPESAEHLGMLGLNLSDALESDRLSTTTFARINASLEKFAGLSFDAHATYRLEARLRPRVRAVGAWSFEEYARLLEGDSQDSIAELSRAVHRLTVHETYFYRETSQLLAFAHEVLPMLWRSRMQLRVWSAGCSTGEEAWTLSMLLEDFRAANPTFRWEVHGTDIVSNVVDEAKAGVYGRRSFRGDLPEDLRANYFTKMKDGRFSIRNTLRDRVRFSVDNLVEGEVQERAYDVIFCRNVLIYLSRDARRRVIERFYRSLRPGGVLLLGHSESLFSLDTKFRLLPLSKELTYARPPVPDTGLSTGRRK